MSDKKTKAGKNTQTGSKNSRGSNIPAQLTVPPMPGKKQPKQSKQPDPG